MNRQDYLQKNFELSMDLRETERQIVGLYNRKKQILEEMDAIQEQMVEDARNGTLYKEDEEHGDSCVDFGRKRQRKEYEPAEF